MKWQSENIPQKSDKYKSQTAKMFTFPVLTSVLLKYARCIFKKSVFEYKQAVDIIF